MKSIPDAKASIAKDAAKLEQDRVRAEKRESKLKTLKAGK